MRIGISSLVLLCLSTAQAEPAPRLSEGAFLARVEASPVLAAVLAEEGEVARAEALGASLWPNPRLEIEVEEPGADLRETTAVLTWSPARGRSLDREAAARAVEAAEQRSAWAHFQLRQELRAGWAEWSFRLGEAELLAEALAQLDPLLEQTRARARAGEVSGLAARRLALEVAETRSRWVRAEAAVRSARARVAAWWPDLGEEALPEPLGEVPALSARPAAGSRPDLDAAEREVARLEALARRSRQVAEAPELGLGWKRIEQGSEESSGAVVSLGWTLPLVDRRQGQLLASTSRLTAARARLVLARQAAEAELAGAWEVREGLQAEARRAAEAASEVEALLTGATAAFRAGEADLTDLLDALRAALGARQAALDLAQAAWAAHRDLEAAVGRLLPGDLP